MRYLILPIAIVILAGVGWFLVFSKFSPFKHNLTTPLIQNPAEAFQIEKPEDGDVVTISNLEIKGKTKPATFLAVYDQTNSQVQQVSSSGDFSLNLPLAEGYNLIKLANFESDGTLTEKDLNIFYLSDKFESSVKFNNPPTSQATTSAKTKDLIQRLAELRQKKNLKIVAGTLKGILVKNLAVEAQNTTRTVVVDSQTSIGNYPDFATNVDFAKIQAQDFVVGVGSYLQQGILTARILLVNHGKTPDFTKSVKFGILTASQSANLKNIEITDIPTNKKTSLTLDQNTQVFDAKGQKVDLKNLTVGNKVLAVGQPAEKILQILGNFLSELEKFITPPPATQSATASATSSGTRH